LATFCVNKVHNIKTAITAALSEHDPDPLSVDLPRDRSCLTEFSPVTSKKVGRLFHSMSAKSSPLDFVPTSLMKTCSCTFAHIIARLANLSFPHATFPAKFKTARMIALLKKRGNDPADPSTYRPISNLNTISKVLGRLALLRIILVLASSNFDHVQSAYRKKT